MAHKKGMGSSRNGQELTRAAARREAGRWAGGVGWHDSGAPARHRGQARAATSAWVAITHSFALIDGQVKFDHATKLRKRVSIRPVAAEVVA